MSMNKPSPRLAILRAQLAAKAADESFARTLYSYSAQNPRTMHHYHPDHDEDLANWLKSLAPAKPAAPQPCQAPTTERRYYERQPDGSVHDVEPDASADVWHSEAPSVSGVYIADTQECVMQNAESAKRWLRHWDGKTFSSAWQAGNSQDLIEDMRAQRRTKSTPIQWLRLIDADAPAARLASTSSAAELQHLVCVVTTGSGTVGYVQTYASHQAALQGMKDKVTGADYRLCDKDGWIPHAAGDGCPAPVGVGCQLRLRARTVLVDVSAESSFRTYGYWNEDGNETITHWRPIAKDAS